MKFPSWQLFGLMALSAHEVAAFAPASSSISTKVASTPTSATSTSSASVLRMGDESRATDNREDIPQSVLLDMHGTLASLFGSDHKRASFFTHQYGALRRTPEYVVHLTRDPIMDIPAPVKGFDAKRLYDSNDYISLRIKGSRDLLDRKEMDYDKFQEYIQGGGSAIVPIIEGDYMFKWRQALEKVFDQELSVNVYHSGPKAEALNQHYDTYDVFVLQLEGEKTWTIQEDGKAEDLSSITSWKTITMREGDLLYVPKGIFHAAQTAEGCDVSTHVTIGLQESS